MAGRLISPPVGLGVISIEPLSGPRSVGGSSSESATSFVQTTSAPFALWRFQFAFHPMCGAAFRRYRGWVTALHGGANATRWSFYDPDKLPFAQSNVVTNDQEVWTGVPWSNEKPWTNRKNWGVSRPKETMAAAAALGDTIVRIGNTQWGRSLDDGDYIGFWPFHFGLYMITERINDEGAYRIWPPLRKPVAIDDIVTLDPVLALRLESETAATAGRGLGVASGATATMVEVFDYDVRDYFAG